MSDHARGGAADTELQREARQDFQSYVVGLVLALILTLIPFALVAWASLSRLSIVIAIGACAVLQGAVHFRFFLHIGLRRNREDLHLILFSVVLLIIMLAGTIWIMTSLSGRMAMPMSP